MKNRKITRTYKIAAFIALASIGLSTTAAMADGTSRQSPIDIKPNQTLLTHKAAKVQLNLSKSTQIDVNNTWDATGPVAREWGTLKATVPAGSTAVVNGKTYNLLQFHFHTPSEHEVQGKHEAMEMHFVFLRDGAKPCQRDPDALLVIGMQIAVGKPNPQLAQIFDQATLPENKSAPHLMLDGFNLAALLPTVGPSWRYDGSLTAPANFSPTCDEAEGTIADQLAADVFPANVQWIVLQKKITMSQVEIDKFRALFPENNARAVQDTTGRVILNAQ